LDCEIRKGERQAKTWNWKNSPKSNPPRKQKGENRGNYRKETGTSKGGGGGTEAFFLLIGDMWHKDDDFWGGGVFRGGRRWFESGNVREVGA